MKLNLLIVDDDKMVQTMHTIIVKRSGFSEKPFNFVNGKEALDFIVSNGKEEKYLILLDINMPVMNGWELLDAFSEFGVENEIFVVMVSSSIDQHDLDKASTYSKVISYVSKPMTKDILDGLRNHDKLRTYFF
ncbi:response regulator [Arcicella rigui]|uniref:Response regulator n=1 Tax=Arcicella rigui TaxID=797020 RepID=A0ABU5Q9J0_9BACT|nr:response regulator [Arcicella rigui]MEA5139307.1 response regulator [Arcicella rigui]